MNKEDYDIEVAKEYTTLEERIAELEAQIEKMKDCQNCKNDIFLAHEEPCLHCTRCFASEGKENVSDKWELEE